MEGSVLVEVVEDHLRCSLTLLGGVTLGHGRILHKKGSGIKPKTVHRTLASTRTADMTTHLGNTLGLAPRIARFYLH